MSHSLWSNRLTWANNKWPQPVCCFSNLNMVTFFVQWVEKFFNTLQSAWIWLATYRIKTNRVGLKGSFPEPYLGPACTSHAFSRIWVCWRTRRATQEVWVDARDWFRLQFPVVYHQGLNGVSGSHSNGLLPSLDGFCCTSMMLSKLSPCFKVLVCRDKKLGNLFIFINVLSLKFWKT